MSEHLFANNDELTPNCPRWFRQSPIWHTTYMEPSANCLVRLDFRSPCNEGNAPCLCTNCRASRRTPPTPCTCCIDQTLAQALPSLLVLKKRSTKKGGSCRVTGATAEPWPSGTERHLAASLYPTGGCGASRTGPTGAHAALPPLTRHEPKRFRHQHFRPNPTLSRRSHYC